MQRAVFLGRFSCRLQKLRIPGCLIFPTHYFCFGLVYLSLSSLHLRFVDLGETTERAVQREVEEETGIIIPDELIIPQSNNKKENQSAMKLIGVYSDPRRDNRRHIVSVAYALEFSPNVMTTKDGSSVPKAGDDAKEVIAVPLRDIGIKFKGDDWYADHLSILLDFKEQILDDGTLGQGLEDLNSQRKWELYGDVARSTCRKI
mmetsp:Transcript_22505/g.46679  ORF Transcript_22505/g.46679 Transcript_22505/m.46679 type:complete len:203 (+) Transcript_22505:774-1382(+)